MKIEKINYIERILNRVLHENFSEKDLTMIRQTIFSAFSESELNYFIAQICHSATVPELTLILTELKTNIATPQFREIENIMTKTLSSEKVILVKNLFEFSPS